MSVIRLISCDAGSTLGTFGPPGTDELLCSVSPFDKARVKEEARRFLHTNPRPTPDVISGLCGALMIDPADLPVEWPAGTFTAYPYAEKAVIMLKTITGARAVVISNIPCTTGPGRVRDLRRQLPVFDNVYTSYDMQLRKPDARLWQRASADQNVPLDQILHIGDQWMNDVYGAVHAGCRAIYVNTRGVPPPPRRDWPAGEDRIGVADDLLGAVEIVQAWAESSRPA